MKTTANKKKTLVKQGLLSLSAIAIGICAVIGSNVDKKHQRISDFLNDLAQSSISAVDGNKNREAFVQEYAEDAYFKETIFSILTSYKDMEPTEDGDRRDGLAGTIKLVGYLEMLGYKDSGMDDMLQQFVLEELAIYMEKNDFESVARTIALLDTYKIENEEVKSTFQTYLSNIQTELFNGNGSIDIYEYIRTVSLRLEESYYTTILVCYPYDEMIDYINKMGQLVISEDGCGGYYDDLKSEYINESYWVDPLLNTRSSKGEVGTYQHTESNELFGDFRVCIVSKYWYQTAKNDSNNSLRAGLYYQDNQIMSDYEEITAFLRKITSKNCYHVLSENGHHMFFVLEKDQITVLGHTLFTIAYE